jgi:hypothetical protein
VVKFSAITLSAQRVRRFVADLVARGCQDLATTHLGHVPLGGPKKAPIASLSHHARLREAMTEGRRARISRIRDEVKGRARGRCEALHLEIIAGREVWMRCRHRGLALDHWLGGSGRRRPFESVETTWLLCIGDDRARTANDPTAEFWNRSFAEHCRRWGYAFTPHIEHAPLGRIGD